MQPNINQSTNQKVTIDDILAIIKQLEEARLKSETEREAERAERKKANAEFDKQLKALSANIGGVNNELGRWAEAFFGEDLWLSFNKLGYEFTRGGPCSFKKNRKCFAEVDNYLQNGEYCMAIEVKSKVKKEHIDEHIERLKKIGEYYRNKENPLGLPKILGAIAGVVFSETLRQYAQDKGLFVILQSGEKVKILPKSKNFKPAEW